MILLFLGLSLGFAIGVLLTILAKSDIVDPTRLEMEETSA